jgi:hypothetical protein
MDAKDQWKSLSLSFCASVSIQGNKQAQTLEQLHSSIIPIPPPLLMDWVEHSSPAVMQ